MVSGYEISFFLVMFIILIAFQEGKSTSGEPLNDLSANIKGTENCDRRPCTRICLVFNSLHFPATGAFVTYMWPTLLYHLSSSRKKIRRFIAL